MRMAPDTNVYNVKTPHTNYLCWSRYNRALSPGAEHTELIIFKKASDQGRNQA